MGKYNDSAVKHLLYLCRAIENSVIRDSKIVNGVRGLIDDAKITLKGVEISSTELFTDLDVPDFCSKVAATPSYNAMSSREKESIRVVLQERDNRTKFFDKLFQHLISFSEGIAASVIATHFTK